MVKIIRSPFSRQQNLTPPAESDGSRKKLRVPRASKPLTRVVSLSDNDKWHLRTVQYCTSFPDFMSHTGYNNSLFESHFKECPILHRIRASAPMLRMRARSGRILGDDVCSTVHSGTSPVFLERLPTQSQGNTAGRHELWQSTSTIVSGPSFFPTRILGSIAQSGDGVYRTHHFQLSVHHYTVRAMHLRGRLDATC